MFIYMFYAVYKIKVSVRVKKIPDQIMIRDKKYNFLLIQFTVLFAVNEINNKTECHPNDGYLQCLSV